MARAYYTTSFEKVDKYNFIAIKEHAFTKVPVAADLWPIVKEIGDTRMISPRNYAVVYEDTMSDPVMWNGYDTRIRVTFELGCNTAEEAMQKYILTHPKNLPDEDRVLRHAKD